MASCAVCKETESSGGGSLAVCDKCSSIHCQACAGLSASEMRAIVLKKRIIIYLCSDCRPLNLDDMPSANSPCVPDPPLSLMREEVTKIADFVRVGLVELVREEIRPVFTEMSNLRQTNVDLLGLLSNMCKRATQTGTSGCDGVGSGSRSVGHNVYGALSQPVDAELLNVKAPMREGSEFRPKSQTSTNVPSTQPSALSPDRIGVVQKRPSTSTSSKPTRPPPVIGSKTGASRISAAVIHKKTSILVSKLDKSVSASDLEEYLHATFGQNEEFVVEEQTVRSGDYKSFRVETKLQNLEELLMSSNWPQNVLVKRFRFFRQRPRAD